MESRTIANTETAIREFIHFFKTEIVSAFYPEQYDRDSIEYIFQELLNNAFEHGNLRDPTKTITIAWEAENGRLVLSVKDQGRGFSAGIPDRCPQLGEPRGRGLWSIDTDEHVDTLTFLKGGSMSVVTLFLKEHANDN